MPALSPTRPPTLLRLPGARENPAARSQGLFLCMLGVALASLAGRVSPRESGAGPGRDAPRPDVRMETAAAPSARLDGSYRADIDGRILHSPHPPVGEPVTLAVPGMLRPVRAVRLELQDRNAPYYLGDDGRMLETQWRWAEGTMSPSVRYRRGMLEVPSPT